MLELTNLKDWINNNSNKIIDYNVANNNEINKTCKNNK